MQSEINILKFDDFNAFKTNFRDKPWYVYETEDKYVFRTSVDNLFIAIFEYHKGLSPDHDLVFDMDLKRDNVIHVAVPEDIIEDIEETILEDDDSELEEVEESELGQ